MTTAIIVQARMTSTRLPGKVLLPIAGRSMLSYQLERLRRVGHADRIIIATTTNATDDPIVEFCAEEGVDCTRGSEDDVLARYFEAATRFGADTIVRITSDCPLIDPELVDETIGFFLRQRTRLDYVSNSLKVTYPRGMDVEVFSFQSLREAFLEARQKEDREHVTPFLYRHPERYRIGEIRSPCDLSKHRWTVDTREDFELVTRIVEILYPLKPDFHLADIVELIAAHPDWPLINSNIRQVELEQQTGQAMENTYKTEQEAFWAGEFGNAYCQRNCGEKLVAANLALFSRILQHTSAITSAIEFGANIGLNLKALRALLPSVSMSAIEINPTAVSELIKLKDIKVHASSILDFDTEEKYDLVLIKGVLIHIDPASLPDVYDRLYKSCCQYICVVEYYNPTPVEVNYRGHSNRLFKRDFAGEMLDRFPDLKLIDYGFVYHRDSNFSQDDINWFLLEKH